MFQTTPTPVKVYRSTDPEAPRLEAVAGSLKTLLKACLVAGYGTGNNRKESLGWAMPFEDVGKAVFKSQDTTANPVFLQVAHEGRLRSAYIKSFFDLTDFDTGIPAVQFGGNYDLFAYFTYTSQIADWWLIGHSKAFILIIKAGTSSTSFTNTFLWFGDVPSLLPADQGNTICINNRTNNNADYISDNNMRWFGTSSGRQIGVALNQAQQVGSAYCRPNSLGAIGSISYPDVIHQGLIAHEIYLHDSETGAIRFLLPGSYLTAHDIGALADGDIITMDDGQQLMKFKLDGKLWLINTTQWEY